MRILGIDPGSIATGYGIVELDGSAVSHIASGVIRARGNDPGERLASIQRALAELVQLHRPHAAALESVFSARNPRAALKLGQARGVALAVCGGAGLPTAEYAPARVKTAVASYGRADKTQVQWMVQRLLALASPPPTDAADALAVAICHCAQSRSRARLKAATGARAGG